MARSSVKRELSAYSPRFTLYVSRCNMSYLPRNQEVILLQYRTVFLAYMLATLALGIMCNVCNVVAATVAAATVATCIQKFR